MEKIIEELRRQMDMTGADYVNMSLTFKDGYVLNISLTKPDQEEKDV